MKQYKELREFSGDHRVVKSQRLPRNTKSSKFNISDDTTYFHVMERVEVEVDVDDKKIMCSGNIIDFPIVYYVDGWIYNLDEIKQEFPDERDLIMRGDYLQEHSKLPIRYVKVGDNFYIYGLQNKIWKTKSQQKK